MLLTEQLGHDSTKLRDVLRIVSDRLDILYFRFSWIGRIDTDAGIHVTIGGSQANSPKGRQATRSRR